MVQRTAFQREEGCILLLSVLRLARGSLSRPLCGGWAGTARLETQTVRGLECGTELTSRVVGVSTPGGTHGLLGLKNRYGTG